MDSKRLNQTELLQRGFWEGGLEQLLLSNLSRGEAEAGSGEQEDILTDPEACILRRSTYQPIVQIDSPDAMASLPMQLPRELYSNIEDLVGVNVASQQNSLLDLQRKSTVWKGTMLWRAASPLLQSLPLQTAFLYQIKIGARNKGKTKGLLSGPGQNNVAGRCVSLLFLLPTSKALDTLLKLHITLMASCNLS